MDRAVIALGLLLLPACSTLGQERATETRYEWQSADTFVSAPSSSCSLGGDPRLANTTSDSEVVGALFAPLLANLAQQGLNRLGVALKSAGEARSASLISGAGSGYFSSIQSTESGERNIPIAEVSANYFCVRTLVATYRRTEAAAPYTAPIGFINDDDTSPFPPDPELANDNDASPFPSDPEIAIDVAARIDRKDADFSSREDLLADVNSVLDGAINGEVTEVHFYSEHLVAPVVNRGANTAYVVVPIVRIYNKGINGRRYALTSQTLTFNPVVTSTNTMPLMVAAEQFAPNGLRPGHFYVRTEAVGDISELARNFPLLSAGIVSESERKTVDDLNAATQTLLGDQRFRIQTSETSAFEDELEEQMKFDRNLVLNSCLSAAGTDSEKKEICTLGNQRAEHNASDLIPAEFAERLSGLRTRIRRAGGNAGYFNVFATLQETRKPNQFFLALAGALSDSADTHGEVITDAINRRLGVTEEESNTLALNTLRLERLDYDIANRSYQSALQAGEQTMIDSALRSLVERYNALLVAGEAANVPITVPSPY